MRDETIKPVQRGLRTETNQLAMFREVAEALNEVNDVTAALTAILPKLGKVLELETIWAFRYDAKRLSFVEVGASGLPAALACCEQRALKAGWCECQSLLVEGHLDRPVNLVKCTRLWDAEKRGDTGGLTIHASVPLRSHNELLGILNVAAPGPARFTKEALAFLQTVGQQLAIAMDRSRALHIERDKARRLQELALLFGRFTKRQEGDAVLQEAIQAFADTCQKRYCCSLQKVSCTPHCP